ncbi:LytR/AlgR family response regulator transcription factor [Permianibacter aggregans]|uniref:LytTR family two component transcriptional regulator n=1 Tax=Permianibacter aggregans TaxID=1510150 RepID=A0A4R6UPC1_9GAMM|nr:LytTR family DNA-binding domain-containing protein [Permianibacter aggregans]TDQ49058.1 LytTR family two component transcriptional regulator [Permianibacter aggregans]
MNILIADDEPLLRAQLKNLLLKLLPDALLTEAEDGYKVLECLKNETPDVAFLDIRMPGLSGMELAEHFPDSTQIVFVTAYDEYAIEAFEKGAVDYLLKPVEAARLSKTIERLQAKQRAPELVERSVEPAQMLRWIHASTAHSIQVIPVDEVIYFRSDAKYTKVRTAQAEAYIRTPIKELVQRLDAELFWQIHRSAIVNARHIERVLRDGDGGMTIVLKGLDERLPVSSSYHHLFRQM